MNGMEAARPTVAGFGFSEMLEGVRNSGRLAARRSWLGHGKWVGFVPLAKVRAEGEEKILEKGPGADHLPGILAMHAADNTMLAWQPSQHELMAQDYVWMTTEMFEEQFRADGREMAPEVPSRSLREV